ncbi:MAG: hypothetical protein KBF73_11710 [Flavobacteriales bacterium]|nr:hypothetical protein [Flavobacteriales bacterium]
MTKISSESELRAAIVVLEQKQAAEAVLMKAQFELAYESVKPINLIKSTIKEVTDSQDIKDHLLNAGVGIAAGYISEKIVVGESHDPIRKLFGAAVTYGVTNVVTNNPELVKAMASSAFRMALRALHKMRSEK